MRIAIASFGAAEFSTLRETCLAAGHQAVVYVFIRSMRSGGPAEASLLPALNEILEAAPPGMDVLLPGTREGLSASLSGYAPDLLITYGFNWKLPREVLTLPRFGAINMHSSLLPEYRGPAPILWAIRNGDEEIGLTIHRMDEEIDAGPILAQRGGIPLDEEITFQGLRERLQPIISELLPNALDRISKSDPGRPQRHDLASYAGFLEPEFFTVDWSRTAREIHNQVRTIRFINPKNGPTAELGGGQVRILRTSLTEAAGMRVECADAPIWVLEMVPACSASDPR